MYILWTISIIGQYNQYNRILFKPREEIKMIERIE